MPIRVFYPTGYVTEPTGARGFYERLGYEVYGEIPDHPVGSARYFMSKRFG